MREFHELLRSTSRTFAVGIEALPASLRDAVTLAYLVLRVSDYFEDSPTLSEARKQACLERWAHLLEAPEGPEARDAARELSACVAEEDRILPDHRAALEASAILGAVAALPADLQGPIRRHTADTTRGMARWVERGDDFPDEAALDDYMYEVAGRVGLLLTDLFVVRVPGVREVEASLREVAVAFGLGLQTVNVIRGLHEDPERGWSFIPRTLLDESDRSADPRALPPELQARILDFLVRKASVHLADAFRYCALLPRSARGVRIFCIVPALLAARTAEAARHDPEVFRAPVKIGRREVRRLVLRTRILFFRNGWLEAERRRALALAERRPGASGADA